MRKLEELKKQKVELDKMIETLEYAERIFEEGEPIWSIDHFGNVQRGSWGDHEWISCSFVQGNIFKTGKAAELEAKRRNLLTRFRFFINECNGDWKPVSGKNVKLQSFSSDTVGILNMNNTN